MRELVIMGSTWNDVWNLKAHEMESYTQTVIERWPSRILFSSHGKDIQSGQGMMNTPEDNPVRAAYKYYFKGREGRGRASWDQLAVLCAVRGTEGFFTIRNEGDCKLFSGWKWKLSPLRLEIVPKPEIAWSDIINNLMVALPTKLPFQYLVDVKTPR